MKQIEAFDCRSHRAAADLLDDTDSMVGIDNFVTNVEVRIQTAHIRHPVRRRVEGKNFVKQL